MDLKTEIIFDSGTDNLTFSLRKQNYMMVDGKRQNVGNPTRMAVKPGDIEKAKDFVYGDGVQPEEEHPVVAALNSMWTDEVVEKFKQKYPEPIRKEYVEQLPGVDPLTGLYNRQSGIEKLHETLKTHDMTICVFDVDKLGEFNAKNGREEGDKFLLAIVDNVKQHIWDDDIFFRIGGDEFLIASTEIIKSEMTDIMGKVRDDIAAINGSYRISYGIINIEQGSGDDLQTLINPALDEMFDMKKRNAEQKPTRGRPRKS